MESIKKTLLEAAQAKWPGTSITEGEMIQLGNPWDGSLLGQELTFRILASNKVTHIVHVQVEEGSSPRFVKFSDDWLDSKPFNSRNFVSELQTFFKID